jgi:hypothetical protein
MDSRFLLALRCIQMIYRATLLPRLSGEGRDLFAPWAPASAGMTGFLVSTLARRRLVNHVNGTEH